jgi:hypothetical protein
VALVIRRITIAVLAAFLAGAVLAVPASSKSGPATVAKKKAKKCKKGKKGKKGKKRKGCKRGSSSVGLPGEATPSSPKQPNTPPPPPDTPALEVKSLTLTAGTVLGGNPVTGQVTLDKAAPAGGQQVDLSSTLSARAQVPASVVVIPGQKTASFQVDTTFVVGPPVTATLTASIGASSATTALKVVDRPSVDSVKLERRCFTPETWPSNRVTLDIPAPSDTVVTLSSTDSSALDPTPSTVTVPSGSNTTFFTIQAFPVVAGPVTISAAAPSTPPKSASASVNPTEPDANAADLTLNPTTVAPDSVSTATVTLDCEAPEAGTTVSFTSQSPSKVHVPGPIVIPEGQLSATFQVTVDPGTPDDQYEISATAGEATVHADLTVSSFLPT